MSIALSVSATFLMTEPIRYRRADPADALQIAVLAMGVFLDTYADSGIRPDLAREVLSVYAPQQFDARLADPNTVFFLAERGTGVLGFSELTFSQPCPAPARDSEVELVRLYIMPRAQRLGLGRNLIELAENEAASRGYSSLWLTAWEGNHRAHSFYRALGYQTVGEDDYHIEGQSYRNLVWLKDFSST